MSVCSQLRSTLSVLVRKTKTKRKFHQSASLNIVRSKTPNNPVPELTIDQYVFKDLHKWHDKTATVCSETGRNYSYSEVQKKSNALANFLHKFPQLQQGDTVAIVLPNIPEYPIIVFGALQAGLKITTINSLYTEDEIAGQLANSQTKMVFTLAGLNQKVQAAVKELKGDVKVVTIRHTENDPTPSGTIKFDETVNGSSRLDFSIERSVDDVVILPYSSGTTGLPKGVALTHKNVLATLHHLRVGKLTLNRETIGNDQDSLLLMLPMFHIYGLQLNMLNVLTSGVRIVTIPKFTTEGFVDLLVKNRPSFAYLVPPLIQLILHNPKIQRDHISSLERVLSGAAPLSAEDIEKLNEKSNHKICLTQAYGLTESASLITQQPAHVPNGIKLGGSGLTVCNTEIKIISIEDESQDDLGPHKSGEILVRGPQMTKGYYNNLEATRKTIDTEGWFHTGDIGHYDEDEHFFITDRIKDLIKVKGFQVAPAELEAVLRTHPNIVDTAVIGVPHPEFGEVPKAFVIPKTVTKSTVRDVEDYMAKKVANYKQLLGGIVVVDEIPKTLSGKILRKKLREL